MNHKQFVSRGLGLCATAVLFFAWLASPLQGSAQSPVSAQTLPVMPAVAPEAVLPLYPAWARKNLCESNVYYSQNPIRGKIVRFQIPIDINPNGVPEVLEAIRNYEAMSGGAITFRIVNSDPAVGITIVQGDAINRDGEPGIGHVTYQRDPQSGFTFSVNSQGAINSLMYIHLGSSQHDHVREGFRPFSVAEHELGHALGLGNHFAGFTGIEGLSLEPLVTLMALYRVPPGTDISTLCTAH